MSNTVSIGLSNNGQSTHYVVDNTSLAAELGILLADVLGSTAISQNVTGGLLSSPYVVPSSVLSPGGNVIADYTSVSTYDEAYQFVAEGWNKVKNITIQASGNESILFIADNFVQGDLDFSGVMNDVELRLLDSKRSNILSGEGDDIVRVTTATNSSDWSNLHNIHTGDGDDLVVIGKGDESLIPTTIVNYVDGLYTTVAADLGTGSDTYSSAEFGLKTMDHVHGGRGSDTIYTGDGDDILYGDSDFGSVFKVADGEYNLVSKGDFLSGGAGHDEFHYNIGDGFGIVSDGFDHILDFGTDDVLILDLLTGSDTVTTENATLHTTSGDLSGVMVLINDDASVFLQDYTGSTSEIFV